jgi:D-alanyl-D-alanine carboxypeptidase
MKNFVINVLFLCFILYQSNAAQAEPIKTELQTLVNNYLLDHQGCKLAANNECITAVSLHVNGPPLKFPLTEFSGYTDISSNTSVNYFNLYQIGSITKSFIAVILLQLEADPKNHFSINDKLISYLPQYPEWGNIIVKQLLNMTSGIPCYTKDINFIQDSSSNPYKRIFPEEIVAYEYGKPLHFSPGSNYEYSNTNYILAGMIITRITGRPIEIEMNERFLKQKNSSKLTLKNTYYVPDQPAEYISRGLVHGYMFVPEYNRYVPLKTDVTYYSLSPAGAAGAIISTPQDIEKWIQALYKSTDLLPSQQRQELESFVSQKTGQPIVSPTPSDPMGYGLGIQGYYNSSTSEVVFLYLGETLGYRSIYTYYPKENVVISALVNSAVNDNNNHISELVNRAFEILNKK